MLLGQPSWPAPLDCGFSSKPGPTQIPLLYLGSHVLPSTSGTEKYVSASPSPPGISEDCSVSPLSPVVYFRESRSLHSGQQPQSSSFGVFSVRIPAAHRVFADIHRGSKITFQRCPLLRNEAKGAGSVSFVRLFPSCAPLCAQKCLAEEAYNPSFKARHSMSTRRSLLFGVITVSCILSDGPSLSVTQAHQVPAVQIHRVSSQELCYSSSLNTYIAVRTSSSSTVPRISAQVPLRHTLPLRPLLQLITDVSASSPCKAFSDEHVRRSSLVLPPFIFFCSAASPIQPKPSAPPWENWRCVWPVHFLS